MAVGEGSKLALFSGYLFNTEAKSIAWVIV